MVFAIMRTLWFLLRNCLSKKNFHINSPMTVDTDYRYATGGDWSLLTENNGSFDSRGSRRGIPQKMTKPYFCGKIRRGLHITANIANKRLWGYKYKSAVFPSPLTNSSLTRKKNRTINYQSFTTWLIWNVYVTHTAVTKPAVVGSPVYLQLLCRKVIMRDYLEVTDTLHRMQI